MKRKLSAIPYTFMMLLSLLLTACGGGGEVSRDPGNNPDPDPTPTEQLSIALQIVDANGQPANDLSAETPLTIIATVTNSTGAAVGDELVTFTFNTAGLASFNNDTGTALTGSDGTARIGIIVGQNSGDGLVIANAGNADAAQIGFKSAGTDTVGVLPITIAMAIVDADGAPSNELATGSPLTVIATVTNTDGDVIPNELVTFTFNIEGLAVFDNDTGTALTNDQGVAQIGLVVGPNSGDGLVFANAGDADQAQIGFSSAGSDPVGEFPKIIEMTIVDANGDPSNELATGSPLYVLASVTDTDDNAVTNELVTFSFNTAGLAEFDNDTGTALTDDTGVARIGLLVGPNSGDGLVFADVEDAAQAQIGFSSAGADVTGELPASLELFASSIQLASSGNGEVELIAVVKNEQNILMEGVSVDFAANQDAQLQISQGVTSADGTARAVLTTLNKALRTITVTASTLTLEETVDVQVVGTEINLNAPSSVIINDTSPITILVADSDGKGIANEVVELTTTIGTLSDTTPTTDVNGQVTVEYSSNASGVDTIGASALNVTNSIDIAIQEDDFSFSSVPTEEVPLGQNANLTIRWYRENAPLVNGTVTVTASRGSLVTNVVQTNANGLATFQISSNNAGLSSLSAIGVDGNGDEVTARAEVEFIALDAHSINVDASPDLIGPEGETSTITAIVRDVTGNLVKNKLVNFELEDASNGFLRDASATTDSNGIASTVYNSGAVSSEDAVRVDAIVADNQSVTGFTTLTVGERAFDLSIGTGNSIESPDASTYLKTFSVFVSDSVGQPVSSADLTISSTPVKFSQGGTYRKGFWQWNPAIEIWENFTTAVCNNEDINGNGILDAGEDENGDGELTPGIIGTVNFANGNSVSDSNGQAIAELRYPKQFGPWTDVELTVFGNSAGSEAFDSLKLTFPVAAEDITEEDSPPPPNPFGSGQNCTDTL